MTENQNLESILVCVLERNFKCEENKSFASKKFFLLLVQFEANEQMEKNWAVTAKYLFRFVLFVDWKSFAKVERLSREISTWHRIDSKN